LGVMIAIALHRWLQAMPGVPKGDIAVALLAGERHAVKLSAACEHADAVLRQWTVAGLSLLVLTLLLIVSFHT